MVRFLCLILITIFAVPSCAEETTPLNARDLQIKTQDGHIYNFRYDVAVTPRELQQGLMYRQSIPDDYGMLFVFDKEAPRSFWMKNTYVPLDIIFIDKDGVIINIGQGMPLDEEFVVSARPAQLVLEVLQGTAAKYNIRPGDQLYIPNWQK